MKTWMYQMAIASILVLLIAIASSSVLMLMADAAPSTHQLLKQSGCIMRIIFVKGRSGKILRLKIWGDTFGPPLSSKLSHCVK